MYLQRKGVGFIFRPKSGQGLSGGSYDCHPGNQSSRPVWNQAYPQPVFLMPQQGRTHGARAFAGAYGLDSSVPWLAGKRTVFVFSKERAGTVPQNLFSPSVFWTRWVLCSERRTADTHWASSSASPGSVWTGCSEWESASSSRHPANTEDGAFTITCQIRWTCNYNQRITSNLQKITALNILCFNSCKYSN